MMATTQRKAWPIQGRCSTRWRAGLVALLMTLTSAIAPAQPQSAGLPSLGDGLDMTITSERRLGDRIATSIYRDPALLDDAILSDYLQALWQPLVQAALARGELTTELHERFAWQLFLVRDRSVNAFALPGGYLGVHTGLIAAVTSPDELAAVLSHELSHVTQRHIARMIGQQQAQAPWLLAAIVLGVMAAGRSGDAANAAIVGGQAVAAQGQLNFSRDMEREADRVGFGILIEAGFGADGATAMFEKLQQANRFNDSGAFPYLRSHPLTSERIADARVRQQGAAPGAVRADRRTALPSLAWHAMMGGRARVLGDTGPDALQARLKQAQGLPADASREQSLSVYYAAALAAARLRETGLAREMLAKVMRLSGGQPQIGQAARWLGMEVEELLGEPERAAAMVSWSASPSRAELMTQGRILIRAGRAAETSDRLRTWLSLHPRDSSAWALLAQALHQQGQVLQAIRAEAEGRAVEFDYQGAVDRLKSAQDLLRSGRTGAVGSNLHIEASIIDTRARQLQAQLREQMQQERSNR
jgi:predicted Zn-dependent protease